MPKLIHSSAAIAVLLSLLGPTGSVTAQTPKPAAAATSTPAVGALPADFAIGPDDVLGVLFWREQEMSGDVTVRPDGMITLPLVGDIRAAGYGPKELKAMIEAATAKFITEPNVTVVVRQINSRKVFITGEVAKPGAYALTGPHTVMQLIAMAGGLNEYADSKNITVMRNDKGRQVSLKFHYSDVARGKALSQNVQLQPGDTVVVP